MAGAMDFCIHEAIRHRQRPVPVVDRADDLLDRPAIGINGIPKPQEMNFRNWYLVFLVVLRDARQIAVRLDAEVAQKAQRRYQTPGTCEAPPILAIGVRGVTRERNLVAGIGNQAFTRDQPRNHTHGERAAAETEAINPVPGHIVAAAETVDVDDIALQAEAEDTAEDCK